MKKILIIIALCSTMSLFAQKEQAYDSKKREASMNQKQAKQGEPLSENGIDPVCKMKVRKGTTITAYHKGKNHGFCNEYCREVFLEKPEKYVKN
jgi:YHS domain-containing protein